MKYWGFKSNHLNDDDQDMSFILEDAIYFKGNNIFFNSIINTESISKLIQLTYDVVENFTMSDAGYEEKEKNIVYHINSSGGFLDEMFRFIDFISIIKKQGLIKKTTSIINPFAASAATGIAVACDDRKITQNSSAMIHELSAGSYGMYTQLESVMKHLKQSQERMIRFYSDKSKQPKNKIKDLLMKESWFDANEYLKLGFVDSII